MLKKFEILIHELRLVFKVLTFFLLRTMCKKESWISCGIFGFARPVERFGVERYKSNSSKVCCLITTPVTVNFISCHKKGKHVNLSVLDGT